MRGDADLLRRLVMLARPQWRRLALGGLCGALCIGSSIGLMTTSGYLLARAAQRPPILSLTVAIVAVRFFGISRGVLRYAERLVTHDAGFRLLADLRVHVYQRIEPLLPGALGTRGSGDVLRRVVADVDTLQAFFIRCLTPPVVALLVAVLATTAAALLLPTDAVLLGAALLLAAAAGSMLVARLTRRSRERAAAARGELSEAIVDLLQAAPDVVANGAEDELLARLRALDQRATRLDRHGAWAAGLGGALVSLVAGAALCGTLILGVGAVRDGSLDPVLLGATALLVMASFEAVQPLTAAAHGLVDGLAAAKRIFDLVDTAPSVVDPEGPRPAPHDGGLTFSQARLRYRPDEPAALDGFDLAIPRGRRVAIVGASGSGKTSAALAALRFRELDGGTLHLGDEDVRGLAQDDVRRVVGLVAKDAHIFATSIRENIRLACPGASQAELEEAARRAHLLDWITSLPAGWETPAGERGLLVSGGQGQRIAVARALLADFPRLILDEPTAHLDTDTAAAMMDAILAAVDGRTMLLVTHRVTALAQMDAVVVMEAGRVIGSAPV